MNTDTKPKGERRILRNSVVYAIVRNDNPSVKKVIYRIHACDWISFEMSTEEWDSLPTP